MKERRNNWKKLVSEAARKKEGKRHQLLTSLQAVREELKNVGGNIQRYDELKEMQRNITAKLAAL